MDHQGIARLECTETPVRPDQDGCHSVSRKVNGEQIKQMVNLIEEAIGLTGKRTLCKVLEPLSSPNAAEQSSLRWVRGELVELVAERSSEERDRESP